jgi:dissimilatory sulfite reductase (desulfoviridin) alpha/beta subunit
MNYLGQTLQEDKLAILRKYKKYTSEDGRPILYQIKSCRGEEVGCPFLLQAPRPMANRLKEKLEEISYSQRLYEKIPGKILPHQTFKLAVAGCPNSCSMPQIKDFGVIAREAVAVDPGLECSLCRKCLKACKEDAITLRKDKTVILSQEHCVQCGLCARVCPTGSLKLSSSGYSILLGGKVGRHPRFAIELIDLAQEDQAVKALEFCAEKVLQEKDRDPYEVLVKESVLASIKSEILFK